MTIPRPPLFLSGRRRKDEPYGPPEEEMWTFVSLSILMTRCPTLTVPGFPRDSRRESIPPKFRLLIWVMGHRSFDYDCRF